MKGLHFKVDGRVKRKWQNEKERRGKTWKDFFAELFQKDKARYKRKQEALKAIEKRYNKGQLDFSSYVLIKNRVNRI